MDDADLSRRLLKDCVHGDFLAPCNHQKCVGGTFIAQKLWSKVHVLSTNGLCAALPRQYVHTHMCIKSKALCACMVLCLYL
jgi:hypothetical protein